MPGNLRYTLIIKTKSVEMKTKSTRSFYLVFLLSIAFACKQKPENICKVEGKIENLTKQELYIVKENSNPNQVNVDTIVCSKDGKFSFEIKCDSLSPVVIYMEGGNVWATIWVQNQEKITVTGDAIYPDVMLAKGGEINDLLSEFKEQNVSILKEKRDLIDKKTRLESNDSISTKHDDKEFNSKISSLNHQLKHNAQSFIKDHLSSLASLVLMQDYLAIWDEPENAQSYLNLLTGDATKTNLYKELSEQIATRIKQIKQSEIGVTAPDFEVVTLSNDTLNLNSFGGDYLLISFSASWCVSCENDNKQMLDLRKKINKTKLDMLTVVLDENKTDWLKTIENKKIDWYQAIDTIGWHSAMAYRYNINCLPSNILINKEKVIVGRNLSVDEIVKIM